MVEIKRGEGWIAFRAPASLGVADVVALKSGRRAHFYESKSTSRPYERFTPDCRQRLSEAAATAGAEAYLAWWPKGGKLQVIPEADWPPARSS